MIIILKKDGQIVTDDGNPVEGVKLDNAAAILADPKDGDSIVYDATAGMWVAGTGGGSFEPDITNPQDGDTLVYDASEEKWVNGSGGSGGGFLKVGINLETLSLDKTWKQIHDALSAGYYVPLVIIDTENGVTYQDSIYSAEATNDQYEVFAYSLHDNSTAQFVAESENGYPVIMM